MLWEACAAYYCVTDACLLNLLLSCLQEPFGMFNCVMMAFSLPGNAGRREIMTRLNSTRVICMAHPRRIARVEKQIEREVGALLIHDKVLQKAVCPERRRGMDGAVSALASVTDVKISNDLQVAKVYLSIYSDEFGRSAALGGLQQLEGYVRKHIGRAMRLRLTPEIRFVLDESIERSERVLKLLEQVKAIQAGEVPPPPIAIADEDEDEDENVDDVEIVDLGMFEEDDEQDDHSVDKRELPGDGKYQGVYDHGSKDGTRNLNSEEVEEMMLLFQTETSPKKVGSQRQSKSGRSRSR